MSEAAGSFRVDITEAADRLFALRDVVEMGLLAAFMELLELWLKAVE